MTGVERAGVAATAEPSAAERGPEGSLADACSGAARELQLAGYALPSVYLLFDGRLRCMEALGYYQVADGQPPGVGVIGGVVASGRPRLITDVTAVPEFIFARPDIAAEACVPVRCRGEVVGAVNVESTGPLPTSALADLTLVADRLEAWLDAHGGLPPVSLPQRLARLAVELTSLTEVPHIVQRAARAAVELSQMSSAAVVQSGRDGWYVAAAYGSLAQAVRRWSPPAFDVVAATVSAGTSSHVTYWPDAPPEYAFLATAGASCLSAHPMIAAGSVTGLLLTLDERQRLTTRDAASIEREAVLELLAAQTAAALAVTKAAQEWQRLAVTDALTGLPNAAAFGADLERAAAAARGGRSAAQACLLLDVDDFKTINDSGGHLAGDDLLVALAASLQRELRAPDRLYRVGGDEFAALLHNAAGRADCEEVADRLLNAARAQRTTISIGVAALGSEAREVRGRADAALYEAKRAGRNCWRLAPRQV
ncbi:MAG: sensor domain-containing diguanylate cyclase [Actinobacteria bacterium]|nr:sensor domain-containing diguanylate cyclase [Actinomycetota bacterium]MCA1720199.1 sensor domain-containing diguanylate cyclase [Actinomycetota bacterium]